MTMWTSRAAKGGLTVAMTAAMALLAAAPSHAMIGFDRFDGAATDISGQPARQAGSHPDLKVRFLVPPEDPAVSPSFPIDQAHRLVVDMAPGVTGNPRAAATCKESVLKAGPDGLAAFCPVESQVGLAHIYATDGSKSPIPVYNVERPVDAPGLFAFNYLGVVVKLKPSVRASDFGITIDSGIISQGLMISGADVTLWGVPADAAHNEQRVLPGQALVYMPGIIPGVDYFGGGATVTATPRPMLSLGTSCTGERLVTRGKLDGWGAIGSFVEASFDEDDGGVPFINTGCDRLSFEPTVDVAPSSRRADAPTGLEVDLRVPQSDHPDGLATAHVKDVKMVLPEGMSVSPSSAAGLGACSPAQIGLGMDSKPDCPRSSKLGTVSIETPLLEEPLTGDVILATPDHNPFGSLVALYIVAEGSGVRIKLPGRVDLNPVSGRLTASFANNPQLPFSALKVRFDGGQNASLATPTACGRYETQTTVTAWSGKTVNLTSPMVIDQGCVPRYFSPRISAGSTVPLAAQDSPFVLSLDRPDGQQNYGVVTVAMPPGLLARIGDFELCGEPHATNGTCNGNSLIGNVTTTAGPGSAPLPVRGRAYLTGPYKGAPYGLSIVVPTAGQAGPFDLGNVIVRAKIEVDRKDAHVTVTSDPMPTMLRGIPLRIRGVHVAIDHDRFMLNPSGCEAKHVGVWLTGAEGGSSGSKVPYRVSGCGDLEQDQKIKLSFTNKTQQRPGKHPGVEAKLTSKGPGVTNLAKVVVKLPLSVALDPDNAKALCEPEQRAALKCPAESIVGHASAKSVLKDELQGPIYFVKGTRTTKAGKVVPTLPKLWIPLSGGGVTIDVNADSHVSRKKLVSTFVDLPDAPITAFKLRLNSGKNGILTIPPNKAGGTCQRDKTVHMQLTGQNGAVKTVSSKVKVAGCKKAKRASSKATARR